MSAGRVLRNFWDLVATRRLDEAIALLDSAGKFWSRPIGYVPMDAFIYIMRAVQQRAPMTFSIRSELESGERAMIEMEGFGTFPSGELYNNSYVFVADVRDDRIIDLREYSDSAYANETSPAICLPKCSLNLEPWSSGQNRSRSSRPSSVVRSDEGYTPRACSHEAKS